MNLHFEKVHSFWISLDEKFQEDQQMFKCSAS